MVKPFGWAYLGAGYIAKETARAILKHGHHKIVSVWNRTHMNALAFAKEFNATAYEFITDAITAPGVEGVYIATTHDVHAALIKLCLTLGKPVLCEKPLTITAKEASALFDEAKAKNLYLVEAMWTWFNATAHQVETWLKQGQIGEVTHVQCTYAHNMMHFARGTRLLDPKTAGGALLDIGVYPLWYCRQLFGMPKQIRCQGALENGVDLHETIELDYGSFLVNIFVAFDEQREETITILGKKGQIHVPNFHMANHALLTIEGLTLTYHDPKYVASDGIPQLFAFQFDAVAKEIRAGLKESKIIHSQVSIDTLAMMDECRKQLNVIYPFEKK
jgi:predicted dehydrogenase